MNFLDAVREAANLCESEGRRWAPHYPETGRHWQEVADILRWVVEPGKPVSHANTPTEES